MKAEVGARQRGHGESSAAPFASALLKLLLVSSLLALPLLASSGRTLALASQAGIAIVALLSYNLLLGRGGMLSFGHAVYTGLGAYAAVHALGALAGGGKWLPVSAIPLVGGVGGVAVAAVLGYLSTRRAGTTFAMISLGLGELVFALAAMMSGFFGGEGGIAANRVVGEPVLGIDFASQRQVYGLVVVYMLACLVGVRLFMGTPLGLLLGAVRDNPGRAGFIGVSPTRVRYLGFLVAGFVAGISGGLYAVNFEIVTPDVVSATRSGSYLLFALLGGTSVISGSIVGGLLMVSCGALLPEITRAWLLYLGLAFILVVMFVPGGVSGWIGRRWQRERGFVPTMPGLALGTAVMVSALGVSASVEMLYRVRLDAALGPAVPFLGVTLNTDSAVSWAGALLLAAAGALMWRAALAWQRSRRAGSVKAPEGGQRGAAKLVLAVPDATRREPPEPAERPSVSTPPAALELHGLELAFGKTEVLRGIALHVKPGERVALIGPNGAGKTSLFDALSGRARNARGTWSLDGSRIDAMTSFEVRRAGLARSFQVTNVFDTLSVADNLRAATLAASRHRDTFWRSASAISSIEMRCEELLRMLSLEARRDALAGSLSYAEQRSLEIGLAIAGPHSVLLLDEPTAGMSQSETVRFVRLIDRVTRGKTLLMVEHDMGVVFGLADRIAVLAEGRLLAFDTPEAVRADARVKAAYLGQRDRGGAA